MNTIRTRCGEKPKCKTFIGLDEYKSRIVQIQSMGSDPEWVCLCNLFHYSSTTLDYNHLVAKWTGCLFKRHTVKWCIKFVIGKGLLFETGAMFSWLDSLCWLWTRRCYLCFPSVVMNSVSSTIASIWYGAYTYSLNYHHSMDTFSPLSELFLFPYNN